jgi:hypothetical protein
MRYARSSGLGLRKTAVGLERGRVSKQSGKTVYAVCVGVADKFPRFRLVNFFALPFDFGKPHIPHASAVFVYRSAVLASRSAVFGYHSEKPPNGSAVFG